MVRLAPKSRPVVRQSSGPQAGARPPASLSVARARRVPAAHVGCSDGIRWPVLSRAGASLGATTEPAADAVRRPAQRGRVPRRLQPFHVLRAPRSAHSLRNSTRRVRRLLQQHSASISASLGSAATIATDSAIDSSASTSLRNDCFTLALEHGLVASKGIIGPRRCTPLWPAKLACAAAARGSPPTTLVTLPKRWAWESLSAILGVACAPGVAAAVSQRSAGSLAALVHAAPSRACPHQLELQL